MKPRQGKQLTRCAHNPRSSGPIAGGREPIEGGMKEAGVDSTRHGAITRGLAHLEHPDDHSYRLGSQIALVRLQVPKDIQQAMLKEFRAKGQFLVWSTAKERDQAWRASPSFGKKPKSAIEDELDDIEDAWEDGESPPFALTSSAQHLSHLSHLCTTAPPL